MSLNIFAAEGGHARDGSSALKRFWTLTVEITLSYVQIIDYLLGLVEATNCL
jgi:hypothetical protein